MTALDKIYRLSFKYFHVVWLYSPMFGSFFFHFLFMFEVKLYDCIVDTRNLNTMLRQNVQNQFFSHAFEHYKCFDLNWTISRYQPSNKIREPKQMKFICFCVHTYFQYLYTIRWYINHKLITIMTIICYHFFCNNTSPTNCTIKT